MLPADRDLLLVGNFNAPDISWNTQTTSTICSSSLCDSIHSKNVIQLITSETHKLGNTIDLILLNCPDRISNIAMDPNLILYHHLILYPVDSRSPNAHTEKSSLLIDSFSRANRTGLDSCLLDVDFSHIFSADVDTCYNLSNQSKNCKCLQIFHSQDYKFLWIDHQNGSTLR